MRNATPKAEEFNVLSSRGQRILWRATPVSLWIRIGLLVFVVTFAQWVHVTDLV